MRAEIEEAHLRRVRYFGSAMSSIGYKPQALTSCPFCSAKYTAPASLRMPSSPMRWRPWLAISMSRCGWISHTLRPGRKTMTSGGGGSGMAAPVPWGKGNCTRSACGMVWSNAVRILINGIGGIRELIATSSPSGLWDGQPGLPIPGAGGYGLLFVADFQILENGAENGRFILNSVDF